MNWNWINPKMASKRTTSVCAIWSVQILGQTNCRWGNKMMFGCRPFHRFIVQFNNCGRWIIGHQFAALNEFEWCRRHFNIMERPLAEMKNKLKEIGPIPKGKKIGLKKGEYELRKIGCQKKVNLLLEMTNLAEIIKCGKKIKGKMKIGNG